MKKLIIFLPLAAFLVLVAIFASQLNDNANGDEPTKLESVLVGKSVPEFSLPDLFAPQKQHTNRLFTHRDGPVLLNVWATWCPTCKAEHKFLNHLSKQGVTIIGLNYKDQRQTAIEWLGKHGDPYQLSIFDKQGSLGLDLGVYGAPETFLIDRNGVIRHRHVGDVNAQNWQSELQPVYEKLVAQQEAQ
ncbi:DsbE family thiol:disulfide interchange protein [Vibrio palustris]|uniref:Thiol:disulfide interchange protein DsbE n=1 Tax=Vibrio palustris TaxID=1918946 RepID=A0A1R4B0G1_9VIBR|nr:DsbE family thiol:disulfide interchange protein [Vibrio palustris]SJL82408.1 Thiol:disulfide interchange protein DsbE [Vibrio palustris]